MKSWSQFLSGLEAHENEIIACLARFERALMDVYEGVRDSATVRWRHDPHAVLEAVTRGAGLCEVGPSGEYETRVDSTLSGLFEIRSLPPATSAVEHWHSTRPAGITTPGG